MVCRKQLYIPAFTIVELLVVIVVIGVLAAITVASYTGIVQKAVIASINSDLDNASKQIKMYQVINGTYPSSIDCSAAPAVNSICIKSSNGNTFDTIKTNNNINPQIFCLSVGNSSKIYQVTDNSKPESGSCINSCLEILNSGDSVGDGVYSINPGGYSMQVYCDMTNDGGGWTLVLQNNSTIATPSPTWNDAIKGVTVLGNLGSDQALFDALVGLGYWNTIGTQLRVQVGTSPTSLLHKATYTFSINPDNYYSLGMSNQVILLGLNSPGIYTTHNNRPFTTFDADHDTNANNCAVYYNNHPWWYTSCWSGNFFSGGGSYQEAPYWTGATTDYYAHGSIWVK